MRPVYVETLIDASLAEVWTATQDAKAHQSWDARFTTIDYLGPDREGLLRFNYVTQLLPGLRIGGVGVYRAKRSHDGRCATSALQFRGAHPLALIGSGAGYWRYELTAGGVRFFTGYDYRPAWGSLGRIVDLAFRPLIGWATAWSFDRLRLWLERGISPRLARHRALVALALRLIVGAAAIWSPPWLAIGLAAAAAYFPTLPCIPSALRCRRTSTSRRELSK